MKTIITTIISAIFFLLVASTSAFAFGKNKVQYQYMRWNFFAHQAERNDDSVNVDDDVIISDDNIGNDRNNRANINRTNNNRDNNNRRNRRDSLVSNYILYFHQNQGELPQTVWPWLEHIYADLEHRFGTALDRPVPIALYGSPALFEQTNIITEILPEEVGGFTELFKNRIALPFNGSLASLRHVLHHEFVHAFVFGTVYGGSVFRAASVSVPLWFNEGLAEILSLGWERESDMYMVDRVLHSSVPLPSHALSQGYIAYKGGQSFLYYLYETGGERKFNEMIRRFVLTRNAERAIEGAYNQTLEELGREWIDELRRIYWPEAGRRMLPSEHALRVTNTDTDRTRINIRPRISPDGSRVAFFTDRSDYMRVVITDINGRVQRRVGRSSIRGSFDSFQAMSGALAWSPTGDELAFIARNDGRSEIRIVNARSGRHRRGIQVPLEMITGLDWSRDGNFFALTGIDAGRSVLYIYDIGAEELVLLDDDTSEKTSPRFSPDGEQILFTSQDTIGINSGAFELGKRPTSNIAIHNIANRATSLLTNNNWNDKQAAFSPTGGEIIFVSDRNGIDNLYIAKRAQNNSSSNTIIDNTIDADDENTVNENVRDTRPTFWTSTDMDNARPLTDYAGSAGHPDWSADGSAAVFQLFMNQSWNIWRMERPQEKILNVDDLALTRWALHEESGGAFPFFTKRPRATASIAADTVVIKNVDRVDNDDRDDNNVIDDDVDNARADNDRTNIIDDDTTVTTTPTTPTQIVSDDPVIRSVITPVDNYDTKNYTLDVTIVNNDDGNRAAAHDDGGAGTPPPPPPLPSPFHARPHDRGAWHKHVQRRVRRRARADKRHHGRPPHNAHRRRADRFHRLRAGVRRI